MKEITERGQHLHHEKWEKILPIIGMGLAIIVLVELVVTWYVDALLGPVALKVILTEITLGRETAIPIGLTGHIEEWWLWQLTWTVDLVYFCFLYPLFLTVYHRQSGKGGFIMRRLQKMEEAAYRHEKLVHRYGPWGVFLFMMIPFLVNGPLVGMVVGRLAGIPTRKLFVPVVLANLTSNAIWVIMYDQFFWQLRGFSEHFQQRIALSFMLGMLSLAIIGIIVDEIRERRVRRAAQSLIANDFEEY